MGDMGDLYNALKEQKKEKRQKNLKKADPTGWNKHSEYHWSRIVNGKKLDYWPSTNKFQYAGKVMSGNVKEFIAAREKEAI
jgi:hypothetical protein